MKKLILTLLSLAFLFTATIVVAGSTEVQNLIGLGMAPELASQIDAQYSSARTSSDVPATNNAIDLGSSSKKFRTGYFGTSIVNDGDTITSTAAKGFVAGEASRAANVTTATTLAVPLYLSEAGASQDLAAFVSTGASGNGGIVDFFKTRATSGQASTIVQNGDKISDMIFWGANGTGYDTAARIRVTVDGVPGASADMPGAIDFQTALDGTSTLASALKLSNDKTATFAGNATLATAGTKLTYKTGGAAATSGTGVCNGASNVTVSTTSIATTSVVFFSLNTVGGTVGQLPHVTTITGGTSFTFACTAADTSTYNWILMGTA